jgi:hypothetical protein
VFEVPGGSVQADGIVRSVVPAEGMGVEFTRMTATHPAGSSPVVPAIFSKRLRRLLLILRATASVEAATLS